MERGIEGIEWMASKPNPHDRLMDAAPGDLPDWGGTGLCAEAQADGVPCPTVGRRCDTCGRSRGWRSPDRQSAAGFSGAPTSASP